MILARRLFACLVNVSIVARMAGRLSTLLDPSRIRLQVQSNKRTVALNEVARLLEGHADVTNFQGFYNELLARERLDTTCLGNEIALPHARTEHVKHIVMAVGRSSSGVLFENSNQTVRLLFVLGTPKSNPTDYLQVVSALCKIFKDPANREALMTAATPEQFMHAIVTAEEKLLHPVS
jgi:mannitol/fructose-specific phosphotransferase system IIA component (Ntr-type)